MVGFCLILMLRPAKMMTTGGWSRMNKKSLLEVTRSTFLSDENLLEPLYWAEDESFSVGDVVVVDVRRRQRSDFCDIPSRFDISKIHISREFAGLSLDCYV